MPVTPTYPGVYIQELSSGVHTITGVATSITAFVGVAKRGPINKAVRIFSFGDYERSFGGLFAKSPMSYAVSQFFQNGGSDAYIVRLAKNSQSAMLLVKDDKQALLFTIEALDAGEAGNDIQVYIDHNTQFQENFDITFTYTSKDNPADASTEPFQNVSLDSNSARYIEDMVNGVSQLVTVNVDPPVIRAAADPLSPLRQILGPAAQGTPGTLTSGTIPKDTDFAKLALPNNANHSFNITLDEGPSLMLELGSTPFAGKKLDEQLLNAASLIQEAVRKLSLSKAYSDFTCISRDSTLVLTSGTFGPSSSVAVESNDSTGVAVEQNAITDALCLTPANKTIRTWGHPPPPTPPLMPAPLKTSGGSITSDPVSRPLSLFVDLKEKSGFMISLDGDPASPVIINKPDPDDTSTALTLTDIAMRIQEAVRQIKPSSPAYRDFTCTAADTADLASEKAQNLTLTSGAFGPVVVTAITDPDLDPTVNDISGHFALVGNVQPTVKTTPTLGGGKGEWFSLEDPEDPDAYSICVGDEIEHTGIHALDKVDLFNLLCLPGVTNGGILTEALTYCQKRRAFLIVDPPKDLKPAAMLDQITGPQQLPKADLGTYAALYYPWVILPDPLKSGKLTLYPPSGIIAGLFTRTDATRGVWKAPAGTDANLVGVQDTKYRLTDAENGTLNPHGVNCLRAFPVYGAVCWGARTVSGDDQIASDYKYVPIRRLALYIEESLVRGTKWAVFEPNDEPLWSQLRLNIGAFMHDLFRKGAFQGQTPKDAYIVKCDKETTTQNDINLGIVNILVGFAPLKPAEFVIISLQQMAGQIEV